MSFAWDQALTAPRPVRVELFTAACLVSGTIPTRFSRVAEILNQLTTTHLPVDDAEVRLHGDDAVRRPGHVVVGMDEILVMLAPELSGEPSADMRIPKQPVRAELFIPPLWLRGTAYVPVGSQPSDGLLNLADRFVPMTGVELGSPAYPALARTCDVAAVRRDRAHLIGFGAPRETEGAADGESIEPIERREPTFE